MNEPNFSRAHLHTLTIVLEPWEHSNLPEDVHEKILELIELCDKYIGKGYTYMVIEHDNDCDLQEIDIL